MPDNPFRIELFTITDVWQGHGTVPAGKVTNPVSVSAVFRSVGRSTCQLVVSPDDVNNDLLMRSDCWASIYYRDNPEPEMTGKVRTRAGGFVASDLRTYQIRDDRALVDDTLTWVRPGMNGSAQSSLLRPVDMASQGQWWGTPAASGDLTGTSGYWDWTANYGASGDDAGIVNGLPTTTESALRKIFAVMVNAEISNRGRLEDSDQLRGAAITAATQLPQVRFDKLGTYMDKIIDGTDVWYKIIRPGAGIPRLVIHQSEEWPGVLTAESGVIASGKWVLNEPTATRVVTGGPGDLGARLLDQRVNLADEIAYNWTAEVFRDATGTELKWPSGLADNLKTPAYYMARSDVASADKARVLAYLQAAGQAALDDGAAKSSVSVTLAETDGFHYGGVDGIPLGTKVTMRAASGQEFTDKLGEVSITYDKDGVKVTPKVGNYEDNPDRRLWATIASLAASQRKLSTSR